MAVATRVALVGGTLIDGTGRSALRDAVVLVNERAIDGVGQRGEVAIPEGYEIVDVSGKTVMPGMFDCHLHISSTTLSVEKRLFTPKTLAIFQTAEMMKRTLHAGFTTIRDAGTFCDAGFRQAVEMGMVEGPRLILAGGIGQTGGHFDEYYPRDVEVPLWDIEMCDGVPAVQKAARRMLRRGLDFIKVCTTGGVVSPADSPEYTEWTMEELKAIVHEASARGKAVMAHAEGTQGIKNAILAGIWSVEHGSMLDEESIQMMLDHGTYLVPTLFVVEEVATNGEKMGLSPVSMGKIDKLRRIHAESFKKAAAAGVKIATGTDACADGMHGRNARELEYMVEYGCSPMEAIVAATKTSAETCRIDDRVGTLEPGKLADLLVVDGDPLEDIAILQDKARLLVVMKEGVPYVNQLQPAAQMAGAR